MIDRRISIAPMLAHTDRHFRYFMRLLSRHTLLYTEMITTGALLRGERRRLLEYNPIEHPLAIQLGGAEPAALARSARLAEAEGYDEINLNIGCPSRRAESGRFGAGLMADPERVAECVAGIRAAVRLPVTVKTRIGIDDQDSYDFLARFIQTVWPAGCAGFIIHARKAILRGLSPRQNRQVPPLCHERVYRLKRDFPDLHISINGGINELEAIKTHLHRVDGVMLGRVALQNPYLLARLDQAIFGQAGAIPTRAQILAQYRAYAERQLTRGVPPARLTRPITALYHGRPGARHYRQSLSAPAPQNPIPGPEALRASASAPERPRQRSGRGRRKPGKAAPGF